MNLKIIDYAGAQVLHGSVCSLSDDVPVGNSIQVTATIKNKAYINGMMQDAVINVIFVDNGTYTLASWIKTMKDATISVLAKEHDGKLYAVRATEKKSFIWKLSDGKYERNVIYSSVSLDRVDEQERFASVVANVGGIEYQTTFWNNDKQPLGERAKKVFGKIAARQTFLVTGEAKLFQGKPSMRGMWFICD